MSEIDDMTAQEMLLHSSLCICADYVHRWGVLDFLEALDDYSQNESLTKLVAILKELDDAERH